MEIAIVDFFMGLKNSVCDLLFSFTNFLGEEGFVYFVFMLIYWLVSKERALKFGSMYLISVGVNNLLKVTFRRTRPHNLQGHGYAFPSGHSQGYGFTAASIYQECKHNDFPKSKRWKIEILLELFIAGILVGMGRMYFGMHYLSDVIAGLVIGVSVAMALYGLYEIIGNKTKLQTWKVVVCLLPVMVAFYFVITFTKLINYRAVYKLYSVLGFAFGVSLGYLLDHFKIKAKIEGDFYNKLKKTVLGTLLMGGAYFIIVTNLTNIYLVPFIFMIFGFVAVAVMPNVLNKTFVVDKEK